MKSSGLVIAALLAAVAAIPNHDAIAMPNDDPDASPGTSAGIIGAAEAEAFVGQQFDDYFVDCQAFVDSFYHQFKYCDGGPCVKKKSDLLNSCLATQGAENSIQSLRILPSSESPLNPNYSRVTAVGLQTVFLALDPTNPASVTPLCFDFAIREDIMRTASGLKSTYWDGFYKVAFGPCDANGN
jgi:hypothetical protein